MRERTRQLPGELRLTHSAQVPESGLSRRRDLHPAELLMDALAELGRAVGALLKEKKQTIAVAESSAGGLINATLVAVPGASAYYLGGAIVYTAASRSGLLGLTTQDMINVR